MRIFFLLLSQIPFPERKYRKNVKLYHGTNYSSAMNIIDNGIDLKYSKPYLDFGPGFYTTPSYAHAAMTAKRVTDKFNAKNKTSEKPYIVEIKYMPEKDMKLSVKTYPRHGKKWGEFVLNNRLTPDILEEYNIREHNKDGRFDVCIGEIADGKIINMAYKVNHKKVIPNKVEYNSFIKDNGKVYPLQYSFHTRKAISYITVLKCEKINEKFMEGR